jgi:tRNA(Ile2) C34 agmatinyltransferase TiaS
MIDPTTLNRLDQSMQVTAFVCAPVCVRCGYGSFSLRRDRHYRCDSCQRVVQSVEYAPVVYDREPSDDRLMLVGSMAGRPTDATAHID